MMSPSRKIVAVLATTLVGCAADTSEDTSSIAGFATSGVTVQQFALQPAPGSATAMWGALLVFSGPLYPPNPFGELPADSTIAIGGVIHNLGDEPLIGATIVVQAGGDRAVLSPNLPASSCLTYQVDVTAALDFVSVSPGPPNITVTFTSPLGDLEAVMPNPGPPDSPFDELAQNPGPPATPFCTVGQTTR